MSATDACDKCGTPKALWDVTPCVKSLTQSPRHSITRFYLGDPGSPEPLPADEPPPPDPVTPSRCLGYEPRAVWLVREWRHARMSVRPGHVVWAYDHHIRDMRVEEGMSVAEIRRTLRDECHLHVGEAAIRDVLKSYGLHGRPAGGLPEHPKEGT